MDLSADSVRIGNFGLQVNKKHVKAKAIKPIHIQEYDGVDGSGVGIIMGISISAGKSHYESSSTSGATGAKQELEEDFTEPPSFHNLRSQRVFQEMKWKSYDSWEELPSRRKKKLERGFIQISDDIFMNAEKPLKEGSHIYEGYQELVTGQRQQLAIKAIFPYTKRNIREVRNLVRLAPHPNVVRTIQFKECKGQAPSILFNAMELCGSENLHDYLNENREKNILFDFKKAMSFSEGIIKGVKHIHCNHIVHRYLKPENILFSLDGHQIKISDFGISKELQPHFTTKKTSQGIDGYRAPEICNSKDISMMANIFSLGIIMYSIFTNGKHPFGENPYLQVVNIINNTGLDLSGLPEEMGTKKDEIFDLLNKMLENDPKKRPTIEKISEHPFFTTPVPEDNHLPRSPSHEEHSEPDGTRKRKRKMKSNCTLGGLSPGGHLANDSLSRSSSYEERGESDSKQKRKSLRGAHSTGASSSGSDEMVELREGLFCNKRAPLREGGRVYKGEQRNGEGMEKTLLAIKFFWMEDPVQFKRYKRALNAILKLQSDQGGKFKYLTKLAYCGQSDDGELYIAMTLCHVTSLADISLEEVSLDQRKNIFLQICRGVAFLHSTKEGREPLAHGDLKPSNVLFTIDGRTVMLSDFGFSKIVDIDKTKIGKTSTSYGGTQGWRAAKHEYGDPDCIKADIFSLGLLGVYILYNKHHPFADPDNKRDPAFWQANIMKLRLPNLEPLKEDHLAQDLFRKMLSHDPDRWPIIEEVLQHCMFWSPTKKITFLYEMYDSYFGSEGFKKKMVKEIKEDKGAVWKLVRGPIPTTSAKTDSNLVIGETTAKVKTENVDAETKALNEMREVIGECWLDRVKEMDEIKKTTVYKKSQRHFGNSLSELLRFIRNISAHALGIQKNRKQETVQYWVEAFPQLIPYLLKIMLPLFTTEDRKEYTEKWAEPGDVDVSHILGEIS